MNRIDYLMNMLKESPNDSFLIYALALEKNKAGNSNEAIKDLEKLIIEVPDYLASYYMLGKLYEEHFNNENAVKTYMAGIVIANKLGNRKTTNELREALQQLTEEE